jgi:hypothetical protein
LADGVVAGEVNVEAGAARGTINGVDFALGLDGEQALVRRFLEALEGAAENAAREAKVREERRQAEEAAHAERLRRSAAAREGVVWERTADCRTCKRSSRQLLHGFDADGLLWKHHICACRGWQCTGCSQLVDQRAACCK